MLGESEQSVWTLVPNLISKTKTVLRTFCVRMQVPKGGAFLQPRLLTLVSVGAKPFGSFIAPTPQIYFTLQNETWRLTEASASAQIARVLGVYPGLLDMV